MKMRLTTKEHLAVAAMAQELMALPEEERAKATMPALLMDLTREIPEVQPARLRLMAKQLVKRGLIRRI